MSGPNGVNGGGGTDKNFWERRNEEINNAAKNAKTDAKDNSILENISQGVQHNIAGLINTVRGVDAAGGAAADVLDTANAYSSAAGQRTRDQIGDGVGGALQWAGNQLLNAGNSVGGSDIGQQGVTTTTPSGTQPYDPAFAAVQNEWDSAEQNWSTAQDQLIRSDANVAAGGAYLNEAGAQIVGEVTAAGEAVANTVSNAWSSFWGGVTEKAGN